MPKKLDRQAVLDIRKQYDVGYEIHELAVAYGVAPSTVSDVAHRRTHKRAAFPSGMWRRFERTMRRAGVSRNWLRPSISTRTWSPTSVTDEPTSECRRPQGGRYDPCPGLAQSSQR